MGCGIDASGGSGVAVLKDLELVSLVSHQAAERLQGPAQEGERLFFCFRPRDDVDWQALASFHLLAKGDIGFHVGVGMLLHHFLEEGRQGGLAEADGDTDRRPMPAVEFGNSSTDAEFEEGFNFARRSGQVVDDTLTGSRFDTRGNAGRIRV